MVAAAVTVGNVFVEDAIAEHNQPLILNYLKWVFDLLKKKMVFVSLDQKH